jgi:probable F420-dependent oxidoreductase
MPRHPFRFGVNVYEAANGDEWIAKAQKIEALGYDTLFVADHAHTFPPIAGMMAAAAATTTLRIGSNVFANDFRHPIMLAREMAAVDVFSNGRLVLGLGTGFYRSDYDQSGIPLDSPGVRVGRLEEAIQIIKGSFTTASFSLYWQALYHSRFFACAHASAAATPAHPLGRWWPTHPRSGCA